MKIEILINQALNLKRLKMWGDPVMAKDGFTANGIDQFSFIKTYQLDVNGNYIGDMSSNNTGAIVDHGTMTRIAELQVEDENTVDQKMEWLTWSGVDAWGAPMRIPGGGNWISATAVRMIGAVYAGNLVNVLEHQTFNVLYNEVREDVPMSRIQTFQPSDWGKTWFTHPYLVHSVGAVGKTDVPHKPKGTVYLPLIFRHPSVWVFDRWLQ